jgi:hypothetical protein
LENDMPNPETKPQADLPKKPDAAEARETPPQETRASGAKAPAARATMIIEITHGTYVHRREGGEDSHASPGELVEVSEREAKRLTALGVAKLG